MSNSDSPSVELLDICEEIFDGETVAAAGLRSSRNGSTSTKAAAGAGRLPCSSFRSRRRSATARRSET